MAEENKKKLSLVVPCYNEEEVLMQFYDACLNVVDALSEELDYEFVFVDDGSQDKTLSIFRELANIDQHVRYISFSRNFGKEAGIYAGLSNCTGDYVVVMDADLQHPPKYIEQMYNYIVDNGYESVGMKRRNRKSEGFVRRFCGKKFFALLSDLGGGQLPEGATDYRMMTRKFVDAVLSLTERVRFTKGIFNWVGFDTHWITYPDAERAAGHSKWKFGSLVSYSLEGITSFSTKPLTYAMMGGGLMSIITFFLLIFVIIKGIATDEDPFGMGTLFLLLFFLTGLVLTAIGLLGFYFSKAYMEIKGRPIYITKETNVKQ